MNFKYKKFIFSHKNEWHSLLLENEFLILKMS